MNKKTFYITTPIYYPSGKLHIGHAYTTSLAWVIRNFKRLNGYDAKMLTGSDEHGQKIQKKSKANNQTEQEYVNIMTSMFKELWNKLEIDYDFFSRTTNNNHKESVKKIFSTLLNKGIIYKGNYKGLYSIQDEEFLTKTQAEKRDGKFYHPTSGHELESIEEETYFLKISIFSDWLNKEFDKTNFITPKKIIKELRKNFIEKGLEDLSVTRTTFDWGIKINEDPKHIIYVWLDALSNYINKLGYNSSNDKEFQKYWINGDEKVQLVGKEITRFHCIYWPILLKALEIPQPTSIISHGWIITPEGKMSKSKGNVIDPLKIIEDFDAETIKYYLSSQINMGQDGIFDKDHVKSIYNTNLANNYGNLLSRTIAMTLQNFDIPIQFKDSKEEIDIEIINRIKKSKQEYIDKFNKFEVSQALDVATKLSKELNGYIDKTEPWTLKEDKERLSQVLNILLNGIYAVTVFLSVVIPNKSNEALKQLNINKLSLDEIENFNKFNNIIVQKKDVLFKRL